MKCMSCMSLLVSTCCCCCCCLKVVYQVGEAQLGESCETARVSFLIRPPQLPWSISGIVQQSH